VTSTRSFALAKRSESSSKTSKDWRSTAGRKRCPPLPLSPHSSQLFVYSSIVITINRFNRQSFDFQRSHPVSIEQSCFTLDRSVRPCPLVGLCRRSTEALLQTIVRSTKGNVVYSSGTSRLRSPQTRVRIKDEVPSIENADSWLLSVQSSNSDVTWIYDILLATTVVLWITTNINSTTSLIGKWCLLFTLELGLGVEIYKKSM